MTSVRTRRSHRVMSALSRLPFHGREGTHARATTMERRPSSTAMTAAVVCCLLWVAIVPADGARVLAVEPVYAKSHWNFMRGVLLALADRGHHVTVYTPFADRRASGAAARNYVEVDTSGEYDPEMSAINMDAVTVVPLFASPSFLVPFMVNGSRFMCDLTDRLLADRGGDGDAFDVFVTEPLSSECASHTARRLDVPLVYTVPAPLLPWIEAGVFGHYGNPAHTSHLFAPYAVPDTFCRRLHSAWLHLYTVYLHYRHAIVDAAYGHRDSDRVPPVKPSMVFVNTHYITERSRPAPAARVDVGGIHLRAQQPLPADILKFIEDSPHGVIFFTFGTVVALSSLPPHIQKEFIDALAEIPQRVLLKYEGELKDKPKNVMTSKWLPQRDILLHPNVKLFICHGGISGVYEAVDAGVPVIGFPLFYDQPRNIANLADAGMAINLDLMSITKNTLLNAINEIVNNETYSKNAKIVSEQFKDRPMTPAESVVYWTEYVIRHKGAPHLKSHALNLTWYQYFLLDVIAAVLLVVLLIIYIIFKVLKCIKNCIFKSSLKSKSKSKPE